MHVSRSLWVIVFSVALLAGGLVVRALAIDEKGPLYVFRHAGPANSYAIRGGITYPEGFGVFGTATEGSEGVFGKGTGPDSVGAVGEGEIGVAAASRSKTGVGLFVAAKAGGFPILAGTLAHKIVTEVMSLDDGGNMILTGTLTQNGMPQSVLRTRDAARLSYASQSASPAIEDAGEGRITLGSGYVALDPAFASTLDPRSSYAVVVTPGGDCRGLYVTAKSLRGFAVRELMGGRSSVAFDYRIVGRPISSSASRLPLYTPPKQRPVPAFLREPLANDGPDD